MYTLSILKSLLPLLPLTLALPLESRDTTPQFNITSLGATFPYPGVYGVDSVNSYVNIAVSYPDSSSTNESAVLSTSCRVDWPAGTTPGPTSWAPCTDTALQFRLPAEGWTSYTNFRVELWEQLKSDG